MFAPTERPGAPAVFAPKWSFLAARSMRRLSTGIRGWTLGALASTLAVLAAVAWYTLTWTGVYPGVRAGAIALGGMSRAEAKARVDLAGRQWEATTLTLQAPQGVYSFTRAELGLHYDRDDVLARALGAGRAGSQLSRLVSIVALAWGGANLAPSYVVDEPVLRSRMQALAAGTDIQPRDGNLRIQGGRVLVTAPIEGRGLDVESATRQIIGVVAPAGSTTIVLPVAERIQPRLNAAVLAQAETRANLLLAPVELRVPGTVVTFGPGAIASWLDLRQVATGSEPLTITANPARVRAAIAPLADQLARAAHDPLYAYDPATGRLAVTVPARSGRTLDVDATTSALLALLEQPQTRSGELVTREVRPALSNQDVARAAEVAARAYLAGPLTFSYPDQSWVISPTGLAGWLTVQPGGALAFDDDALAAYIVALKGRINRPAIDATYTMDDGSDVYRVTGASQTSRQLDGPATFRTALALLQGTGSADRTVTLPVTEQRPRVTEADVAALVPERWIEVDLTSQRLHAVIGKKIVYTAVISSGKKGWETPTGTFYVLYRVANETMTSESIGAEEYYRLENVLYTQYFTNEGHALHYSWWKTPESFGTPSSHGCISQQLADAEYFWNFGRVGTRIYIHGVAPVD